MTEDVKTFLCLAQEGGLAGKAGGAVRLGAAAEHAEEGAATVD